MFKNPIRLMRYVSIIEGISNCALFFVAMPLKYFADLPMAVTIVGSLHGGLFVLYAAVILWMMIKTPRPMTRAIIGMCAALFPLVAFLIDGYLKRDEQRLYPQDFPSISKETV